MRGETADSRRSECAESRASRWDARSGLVSGFHGRERGGRTKRHRADTARAARGTHQDRSRRTGWRSLRGASPDRGDLYSGTDAEGARSGLDPHSNPVAARAGNWQEPINQGSNINTAAEEFHFTQDKDGMVYFTSNRPGGLGGMDIWGAMQQGANAWGPAANLGPQINTAGADMCPALPPGSDIISWFSSRADNSFGSIDIFWTQKVNIQSAP